MLHCVLHMSLSSFDLTHFLESHEKGGTWRNMMEDCLPVETKVEQRELDAVLKKKWGLKWQKALELCEHWLEKSLVMVVC